MLSLLRTFKEQMVNLTLPLRKSVHTYATRNSISFDSTAGVKLKPMTYTPQHIANYFLGRGDSDGIPISPLKLIKLVYIGYGWNIALTGEKLFNEPIEAWQHGPVIESLYHEFKHFKNGPIDKWAETFDFETSEATIPVVPKSDKDTILILSKVWAAYSRFSAWALRNKTHEEGGPWHKVYKKDESGVVLKDSDIDEHYLIKIREYLDAAKAKTA